VLVEVKAQFPLEPLVHLPATQQPMPPSHIGPPSGVPHPGPTGRQPCTLRAVLALRASGGRLPLYLALLHLCTTRRVEVQGIRLDRLSRGRVARASDQTQSLGLKKSMLRSSSEPGSGLKS
jgi:hypothetical protein